MRLKCSVKNCPDPAEHRYVVAGLELEACNFHRDQIREIMHKCARHLLRATSLIRDKYEDMARDLGKEKIK